MIKTRQLALAIGDIAALIAAFFTMIVIRFGGTTGEAIENHSGPFAVLFIAWVIVLFIFDLYDIRRINPNPRNIGRIALAFIVNGAIGVTLFYIFPYFGIAPKITLVIATVASFIYIVAWRRLFYNIFTSYLTRSIILVGDSVAIHRFADEVRANPAIGTIVAIWKHGIERPIDAQLIISENNHPQLLLAATKEMHCTGLSLVKAYEELFGRIPLSLMTDERAMDIISRQENVGYKAIRRFAEIVVAILVLVISSPIVILAMIAIVLETGGPVIYHQTRVGKNGRLFTLYKLRSMVHNAEKDTGAVWAETRDPRVTRIGRIIRKLHIDEIPQMWNMLIGDIALVGPRPERPEFVEQLERDIPFYYLRHIQKPGFTGWGQIKFRYARSVLDSREKFKYDLFYLANRSLLLDLGIVFKTIQIIFTH